MSIRSLKEVADISMGQAPEGSSYNFDTNGYPLIAGAGDFGSDTPSPKKFTTSPTRISKKGDIILCIRATIGDLNWSDRDYCLGRGVAGIRPHPTQVDPKYLWFAIQSQKAALQSQGTGSTFKQVSRSDVESLKILVPSLPEQRRIATILDKADTIRRKRRQAIDLMNDFLRSVFLEMFGDPLENEKGWNKDTLESCCDAIVDCPHSTPTWTEHGVVCLRTSNLTKGGWNWEDTRYVSEDQFVERTARSKLKGGDIILSREGTVGIAAIVSPQMRLCMGQRLVQVRPNKEKVIGEYLLNLLLFELDPTRIERLMTGSTSKHINVKDLRKLPVLLPPLALQQKFAEILQNGKRTLEKYKSTEDTSEILFRSLTSRSFDSAAIGASE